MLDAGIIVDRDFAIDEVDPRIFGGFVEHIGRCVYGGIYEPDHPEADEDGFRKDVLALARELNMPVMRYPGGNFVSGYRWEDGVGPRDKRPRRMDLAWASIETNAIGTNEFMRWCQKANTSPMMVVNLGTRGPEEARQLLEYCNHPAGTLYSDLRREHGREKPHGIKLWCLGNEMDGPWQMCHKTADEYGRVACEAAKLMKWTDPAIELVACGSSNRYMDTFGVWEATVLQHCFEHVDYISIHSYYGEKGLDTPEYLSKSDEMDDFIKEISATCDYVAARKRSRKRIMLAFDEWNVWYHSKEQDEKIVKWRVAPPLVEDVYNMEDALLVGSMLITLMNNADRVKVACIAQLVNVLAPIMTQKGGAAIRQTIFYPFQHASHYGRGRVLQQITDAPAYDTRSRSRVPFLASAIVHDESTSRVTVFAVNRSVEQEMALSVALRGFGPLAPDGWTVMNHTDLKAVNSFAQPENITPRHQDGAVVQDDILTARLAPASWNVIRLKPLA